MPRGSHGSLAKAGKVRSSTPKVPRRERSSPTPRIKNRRNFYKRFVLKRPVGQPKP